jgi:hypothetical protein
MQIRKEKFIYLLFFICIASLFILFAYNGYPLFGGDSYSFLPTAIHIDRGDGLINTLYMPTGNEQMLFYPPIFPYFQSLFLFTNKPNELFVSLAITSILSLFIMMMVLSKLLSKKSPSLIKYILFFVISIGIATGLDTSSGRPEILLNLWISIGLLVYIYDYKNQDYIYGVLLILIGFTSPITGIYICVILLMLFIYKKKKLINYLKLICSVFVLFILFILIYPYSFIELIQTMAFVAQKIIVSRDDAYSIIDFIKYHFIYPSYTFYFILFLSSIIYLFKYLCQSISIVTLFIFLFGLIFYFGFRNLATNYYVYNIYLIYVFIVVSALIKHKNTSMILFIFVLTSIGFVRKTALYVYFYDERAIVNNVNNSLKNFNIVNYSDNSSFWIYKYYTNNNIERNSKCYVYQQALSSSILLKEKDSVIINFINTDNLTIAGIRIANNPPFYYYKLVVEK